jgi:polar amino acid transport system substrate-binding protein
VGIITSIGASQAASPLASTGTLRVAVAIASEAGPFFVAIDGAGNPTGVTVDLGAALAQKLGVPVAYTVYANIGECTDALSTGEADVSFMPVDRARTTRVAFGPAYYLIESTFLVTAESGIHTMAEVDKSGVRVVGIAGSTTIRAASRALHNTVPVPIRQIDYAVTMVKDGRADALALTRDSLKSLLEKIPGSSIVEGAYQVTPIAIAVPLSKPAALAEATAFMKEAKQNGTVRRAFDAVGMQSESVAP